MLNKELISANIPTLNLKDSVHKAIELMAEFHVTHLAVTDGEKYLGLASEDDLLNMDETLSLQSLEAHISRVAVKAATHFIEAVQNVNDYNLSLIPVIEPENVYLGVITAADLLKQLGKITGASEPGGVIVLEMEQRSFSFSEISKLVETNDAQVTQLNTYWDSITNTFLVTVKINKFEISDIIATFQRYEYTVKYYFGEELYENELRSNYDHLMNYLSI